MTILADFRAKYPQYDSMSDADLSSALYRKFYASMPKDEFDARINQQRIKEATQTAVGQPAGSQANQGRIEQAFNAPEASMSEQNVPVSDDVAKSAVSGLARGVADVVGLPGTIGDAANSGLRFVLEKGYEALTGKKADFEAGGIQRFFAEAPPDYPVKMKSHVSGEALRGYLSSATGGATDYQPQTTPGEYARTFGEFAPAAVAGPGGLARKALMTSVPALASETAGQLTEGTEAEPYARLGGALAGGIASAGRPTVVKAAAKGAPSREALKDTTDKLYEGMRNLGIKYDANAFASSVQDMADTLLQQGYRPSVAKEAFGLVDDLRKEIGRSPDFSDISGLVQMVGGLSRAATRADNKPLAAAYNIIRDKLFKLEKNAPLISQTPVSRGALNATRSAARELAKRNIKSRILSEIFTDAETYRSGFESGIRNQINSMVRSKRGKQLFSEAERKALLDVSAGRRPLETLSRFGFDLSKFSGSATFIPTLGAVGAGTLAGDPTVGIALAAAGTAAKKLSPYLTKKSYEKATAAIRSGKLNDPTAMKAAKAERIKANLRRLLAVEPVASRFSSGTVPSPQ